MAMISALFANRSMKSSADRCTVVIDVLHPSLLHILQKLDRYNFSLYCDFWITWQEEDPSKYHGSVYLLCCMLNGADHVRNLASSSSKRKLLHRVIHNSEVCRSRSRHPAPPIAMIHHHPNLANCNILLLFRCLCIIHTHFLHNNHTKKEDKSRTGESYFSSCSS
jgi:hypothetical protein